MGHNESSSKERVQSRDCEEKSISSQLNSSLDTVSLFQERKHRHYKSKYEHRRRKTSHRENRVSKDRHKKHCGKHGKRCKQNKQSYDLRNKLDSVAKQTITQEIHVQKYHFKCVINLNTTVLDHKKSSENSINMIPSQSYNNRHRPIPQCQKPICRTIRTYETKFHQSCKAGLHQRTRDSERTANLGEPKYYKYKRWRHEERSSIEKTSRKGIEKQFDRYTSHPRFDQDDYHITKKSLEIPMSYQNAIKDNKKYESKLDTLIKRTKERERKLVEQSRYNNISSPYTDISSNDFPTFSDYAASLHSRSTLILDPQPCETGYSPSIESFYPIKTEKYSPTSFDNYNNSDFEMNIKSEFTMDSGVYSPIQDPMQKLFNIEDWIKKDIKMEPKEEKFTAV